MSLYKSIKELKKQVKMVNDNFLLFYRKEKSSRFFIILGASIFVLGVIFLFYIGYSDFSLIINFLYGCVTMWLILTGYSLIHKSLRGEWL